MERWVGRLAVITGASSGIGEAVAKELSKQGMTVAALARRDDRLQKLQEECKQYKGKLKSYKCDITDDNEVATTIQKIINELGPISVLINNAALLAIMTLTDTTQGSCRKSYETNVIGLVNMTQHVVESMKKHNITDGHIINVNSIVGHTPFHPTGLGHYCASKNAVRILTESLKTELALINFNTRVTSISPGLVETEMAAQVLDQRKGWPILQSEDIVEGIIFALSVKPNINISELTMQPTAEIRSFLRRE